MEENLEDKPTTIQLSTQLRTFLKVYCARNNIDYDTLLTSMTNLLNIVVPFETKEELLEWFERNYNQLGFKKIVQKNGARFPNFIMLDNEDNIKRVQLEISLEIFMAHNHNIEEVDNIICVISPIDKYQGKPVVSLLDKNMFYEKYSFTETKNLIKDLCRETDTYEEFLKALLILSNAQENKNKIYELIDVAKQNNNIEGLNEKEESTI